LGVNTADIFVVSLRWLLSFRKSKVKIDSDKAFQLLYIIGVLIFYVVLLFLFGFYLNKVMPFWNEIIDLFCGNIKFKNIQFASEELSSIAAFFGIWFFFFNLLPLGGLNGFTVVSILYESLVGAIIPDKIIEKINLLSLPLIITVYGLGMS